MDSEAIKLEISKAEEAHGINPLGFFWLLTDSQNPNLNFQVQNERGNDLKKENWHNLDLSNYWLYAISDNGDFLWYNGHQTVAMNPRSQMFVSISSPPAQFIRLVRLGKATNLFPEDLVGPES